MERMTAKRSANLAIRGRCSLTWMPGTLVAISLYGPPLTWPGLRSNVSIWLGPPFIHSKMQERRRCGLVAVSCAIASSQPDIEQPTTPAADNCKASRRDSFTESNMDGGPRRTVLVD